MMTNYTNYPNGVTSFGVPVLPYDTFTGTHFWVKPATGSDAADGLSPDNAFKTLSHALSKALANNNDVIHLVAENNTASLTTDYQSVPLVWNKNAVHLIGENCAPFIGQRSRIANLSTVTAFSRLFEVTASGCLIANIGFFQGPYANNPSAASVCVLVSGERNRFFNCQISGNGDLAGTLDDAGTRSLFVAGGENTFQHCYIGLDTVIRATQTAEVQIFSGARNMFEDCMINSYTSLSTFKAVVCDTPDRFVLFKNCNFNAVQNITSAVSPTGAIDSGSVNGSVLMLGGGVFGYTNVTTADDPKTLVQAPAGGLVDMGLATGTDIA